MMLSPTADTAIIVAIGVLATVFIASLIGLILVCKFRYCKPKDHISQLHEESNSAERELVVHMETGGGMEEQPGAGVELVGFNSMEQLMDEEWIHDATGLAPECLAILRTCHHLTEKLVAMTMGCNPDSLTELVAVAQRIEPRVDDVVKALYPPLDPRLLEARCTWLVLSVHHLVVVTRALCRLNGVQEWIDSALAEVEEHMQVLREASHNYQQNVSAQLKETNQSECSTLQQPSPAHSEEARV